MRDNEIIDSELGLLLAIRPLVREEEGRPTSTLVWSTFSQNRATGSLGLPVLDYTPKGGGSCLVASSCSTRAMM